MTTAIHTHAENAAFLHGLAERLERTGEQAENVERLHELAAREAEQDAAYVAYVNAKVLAAQTKPGELYTESELDAQIAAW